MQAPIQQKKIDVRQIMYGAYALQTYKRIKIKVNLPTWSLKPRESISSASSSTNILM